MDIITQLKEYKPKFEYFIGVDSDGTAFDAMGIKHSKAFIPAAIKIWHLEDISEEFIKVGEFVNLYSSLRGINRFPGLLKTFDVLAKKLDTKTVATKLPNYEELREFVNSKLPMSNKSLEEFKTGKESIFLDQLIQWSNEGDRLFSEHVKGLKPFELVAESLSCASKLADIMVVSAASSVGLKKDWKEAGIIEYVGAVAGQEAGNKTEQLKYATQYKYGKNKVLMLGDAPGDLEAALSSDALFYPIKPGFEVESWKKFYSEALGKFISGNYAGEYMDRLVKDFLLLLPDENSFR